MPQNKRKKEQQQTDLPTMLKKIITTIYFIYVIFVISFGEVYSTTDWDCASSTNTGTFTRSTDCTIAGNNHVAVANTLEIVGTNTDMNHLITITTTTKKRHVRFLKYLGSSMIWIWSTFFVKNTCKYKKKKNI